MFEEDDLLLVSALQHLAFCERQWGLMYLENIWAENRLTVEGMQLHERADEPETEARGELRIARGLRLQSLRLGLTGRADVVEFHRLPAVNEIDTEEQFISKGVHLEGTQGFWCPYPVEYKRGKPKLDHCDEVQLCAQALCLEEMLSVSILYGALFYGQPWRRYEVDLGTDLRDETETLAIRLHELTRAQKTPSAKFEKKCRSCSLLSFCLPKATTTRRNVDQYLRNTWNQLKEEDYLD